MILINKVEIEYQKMMPDGSLFPINKESNTTETALLQPMKRTDFYINNITNIAQPVPNLYRPTNNFAYILFVSLLLRRLLFA